MKPRSIVFGEHLLAGLRDDLKAERFTPLPVRESSYPRKEEASGDRESPPHETGFAQAALLLVLEPIFEADFNDARVQWTPFESSLP